MRKSHNVPPILAEKLALDRLMARSSEASPKVIKIPILIEAVADNNNAAADQNISCQNRPPGGQPSKEPSHLPAAAEVGAQGPGVTTPSSRIIPILLSDGTCAQNLKNPAPKADTTTTLGQTMGNSEAGGLGGLRGRLAGSSRTNSVEERPKGADRATGRPSGENLVTTRSTSASDIRYLF
jgi:hypothetical protein